MKITSSENFNLIKLNIRQNRKKVNLDLNKPFRDKKEGLQKKPFNFEIVLDGEKYKGKGSFGQDALWLPLNDEVGIKVIRPIRDIERVYGNIKFIQGLESEIFPAIEWVSKANVEIGDNNFICVVAKMENVKEEERDIISEEESYIPEEDRAYARDKISVPISVMNKCLREFNKYHIRPEFTWYKNGGFGSRNVISGKIVDFHMFSHKEDRYLFPTNGLTVGETKQIYNNALERYKKWIPKDGVPKWKGKIYQGMKFDNGFIMPGYSSDRSEYDSFLKIPFMPLDRVEGARVLDIGSNQGFFSFQCALHGAKKVTGVELTSEDVELACEIRDKILKLNNVSFFAQSIHEFLENNDKWYDLVILSSVLHQLYPNLNDSDQFLGNLAKKCQYLFFETPVRHKHYNFSLSEIGNKLENHFNDVRLVYLYDAYSTGYRAIFMCRPIDPSYNEKGSWKGHGNYEGGSK